MERSEGGQISILHVDDEPGFADMVADVLEREDDRFTVDTATSASEALAWLADTEYDCIVSDYDMPGQDGIEFLETVRGDYPELPFILFTGKGSETVASEAISAGATDYLQKTSGTEQYELLVNRIDEAVSQRRTEQRLDTIIESLPDGLVIVDANGAIQQVNEQMETLFGYDRDSLIGEPVEIFVPDEVADEHGALRNEYVADPERRPMGADLELHGVTSDGEEIPVNISLSPVELGGELNVIAIVRDISDHKEHERQLRRKNERLEKFAEIVSHDLRNPLNVLQGRLDIAQAEHDSDHLDAMETAVERMDTLIEDLLTLAQKGAIVEDPEPIDLAACAESSWATVETREATLVTETSRTIYASAEQLRQLLENLFSNAVEHGGADVTVTVGDMDEGFYVADDGTGIPPEEREHVFDAGHSTSDDGTGFGLNIVQELVTAHDWAVRVTESAEGGARFEITGVEFAEK